QQYHRHGGGGGGGGGAIVTISVIITKSTQQQFLLLLLLRLGFATLGLAPLLAKKGAKGTIKTGSLAKEKKSGSLKCKPPFLPLEKVAVVQPYRVRRHPNPVAKCKGRIKQSGLIESNTQSQLKEDERVERFDEKEENHVLKMTEHPLSLKGIASVIVLSFAYEKSGILIGIPISTIRNKNSLGNACQQHAATTSLVRSRLFVIKINQRNTFVYTHLDWQVLKDDKTQGSTICN
uniref:Uncharacterized protein n=1 Tax=Glossina palpalis gambiensis TaxID=67801 RepID=A0A1B0ARH3_9MUSC